MCSTKWPELLGTTAHEVMLEAATIVAQRSFFAVVEPCDEPRFLELASEPGPWAAATVRFTEGQCSGEVTCRLSNRLVDALFDAFTGRELAEPAPAPEQLSDLVGEFSNMVCGTWLTRLHNKQSFTLARPVVENAGDWRTPEPADARMLLTVNELPLVIEVRAAARPAKAGV